MFARVSTIEGNLERLDDSIRDYQSQTIPTLRNVQGFKDAYLLVDRNSGRTISITMWETRESLQSSTATANTLRARAAQTISASQPPKVEIYEVAVSGILTSTNR
jgi:heme-degrading monooxygenase HmoA